MAERLGLVTDIKSPPEGTRRPHKVKVGGRSVGVWGTAYQSDDPSAELIMLRDAENRGVPVRVEGTEEEVNGAKGRYTSFTATKVFFVEGVAAASSGSAPPPTFQDSNRDRSIIAQVAYKIAATLSASGAVDIQNPETNRGSLEAFKGVADYIFYSILETAEGKATGAGNAPEQNPEWAQS